MDQMARWIGLREWRAEAVIFVNGDIHIMGVIGRLLDA